MPKLTAGLLLYRRTPHAFEILLVHPGGPYWVKKDDGVWSIPKGLADPGEDLLVAAKREFNEETGLPAPEGPVTDLGYVTYNNKKVHIWALEADVDVTEITSNLTTIEWPPRSGQRIEIPECDQAGWFDLQTAKSKLVKGQVPFVDRLAGL